MPRKDLDEWILQMGTDLHRLSSELSASGPKLARQKEWAPRVDVIETQDKVNIKVELAGVKAAHLGIQFNGERNALIIRGDRSDDTCDHGGPAAPHLLEIEYGQFAREITLPDLPLDIESSQALLANGMLNISIPKTGASADPVVVVERRITVRRLK